MHDALTKLEHWITVCKNCFQAHNCWPWAFMSKSRRCVDDKAPGIHPWLKGLPYMPAGSSMQAFGLGHVPVG